MISTRTEWILGGISTVVLGALGSGLWSGVFAPLGSFAFRGLLSIVTLGLAAAKDSVYRRAALGFAERASELLLAALAGGVIAIPICMLLFAMIFPRLRKRLKTGSFDRHSNWVQSVLFCTQLFVTSILLVQILLVAYTNSVVAHFHQSLAIVAPHVSDDQLMLYKARFAKVRSRKDFIQLYSDVQLVAEKNGKKQDEFSPW
ncbi:MAG: hypothetical protein DMF08_03100 [Verrucomicrobia bacterium]|nr:MAG: hypothetical protein DMF08_03100 [Verrucomicrobiota bacterium]